ncbi:MAG: T9SS type A sorting domain-containing protein [Sphingobacteriaceae bacterium]|nr:T9SS type A sorting domain-containing protein [Sphingobacteriaceae bacterium]
MLIYPNPVIDNINIVFTENFKESGYSIFDQLGRMVKSGILKGEKNQ